MHSLGGTAWVPHTGRCHLEALLAELAEQLVFPCMQSYFCFQINRFWGHLERLLLTELGQICQKMQLMWQKVVPWDKFIHHLQNSLLSLRDPHKDPTVVAVHDAKAPPQGPPQWQGGWWAPCYDKITAMQSCTHASTASYADL